VHEPPDRFEPDELTLELLGAEHQIGEWVGRELLPIASRIRGLGGNEDDYKRWVLSSHLWMTYVGFTRDRVKKQDTNLESAWAQAAKNKPFDLEDALTELAARIKAYTCWNARTGSRDRAVALALVEFCIEHNCFTRTLSSYELSKWTAGMAPMTVGRALLALADYGLIREVQRTDRRTSVRSAKRYRVNLQWAAGSRLPTLDRGVTNNVARSTGIASLQQELYPPSDLWSRRGLGPGAQRVYEALSDEHVTARELTELTGLPRRSAKRYAEILADHCLAGIVPAAPGGVPRYFRVDTPLDAVADAFGLRGYIDGKRQEVEQRQQANAAAYPGAYRGRRATPEVQPDPFAPGVEFDLQLGAPSWAPPVDWGIPSTAVLQPVGNDPFAATASVNR
jgi:hypothetical protein